MYVKNLDTYEIVLQGTSDDYGYCSFNWWNLDLPGGHYYAHAETLDKVGWTFFDWNGHTTETIRVIMYPWE